MDQTWSVHMESRPDDHHYLAYHSSTLLKKNDSNFGLLTGVVTYPKMSLKKKLELQFVQRESKEDVQGSNRKYVSRPLTTTFRKSVLLKVIQCLQHMHDEGVSHRILDLTEVYIGTDEKHLTILDASTPPANDSGHLGKVILHVLSDGKIQASDGNENNNDISRIQASDGNEKNNDISGEQLSAKYDKNGTIPAFDLMRLYSTTTFDEKNNILTHVEQNSINLMENLLRCEEPLLVYDLVVRIHYTKITFREILSHPFFWSASKKCQFICAIFGSFETNPRFEDKCKDEYDTVLEDYYEMNPGEIFGEKGWVDKLLITDKEILDLKKRYKYTFSGITIKDLTMSKNKKDPSSKYCTFKTKSIYDLMRFFRNRYSHYWEDGNDIKCAFYCSVEGFWNFFATRYPNFLHHIYMKMWPKVQGRLEFKMFTEAAPESKYLQLEEEWEQSTIEVPI